VKVDDRVIGDESKRFDGEVLFSVDGVVVNHGIITRAPGISDIDILMSISTVILSCKMGNEDIIKREK